MDTTGRLLDRPSSNVTLLTVPSRAYLPPAAAALLTLAARDCRWPLGRPGDSDFRFCAAPIAERGAYCPGHARLSRGEAGR